MSAKDQDRPTEGELRFLEEMGMTEVEPGRWSSAWQGSYPGMQEWLDDLGSEGEEQRDLLTRASRVENEFKMEQTGASAVASVQRITSGPLADAPPVEEHGEVALAVSSLLGNPAPMTLTPLEGTPSKRPSTRCARGTPC